MGTLRRTTESAWFALLLPALLALAVYAPAAGFGFVNYDDNRYFFENPHVVGGLSWENVRWAFGIHGPSMWVPLTWLSHQTMVSLFGAAPAPQHLLNIALHAANAALLASWLRRATGTPLRALAVAALFAVHPLHVESVAWVTERKDVLALFFCLLALHAHERHARAGGVARYAALCVFHALAVMAKPLAVTLPCALLLVDAWPLRRTLTARVVAEKLPLVALSAVASWLTVLCQQSINAIGTTATFPMSTRLANAATSYATYLRRLVWPDDLAVFYPYPESVPAATWSVALALLVVVTFFAWRVRRRVPAALVGWLWFLGTLVPMIGLVQAGSAAMADRYAYLPFIGLYVGAVWSVAELVRAPRVTVSLAAAVVVALAWTARLQVGVWRDSETLFRRALAVTEKNHVAHNNLGLALETAGRADDARRSYEASLAARPGYPDALNNLAVLHAKAGRNTDALPLLEHAVAGRPAYAIAWHNLGKVRAALGDTDGARAAFAEAIRLEPDFALPRYDLGGLEISIGAWDLAVEVLTALLARSPDHADAWVNLGYAESKRGRAPAAETAYRRAAALGSDRGATNLVLLLLDTGRAADALTAALASDVPDALQSIATGLRARGDWDNARRALERLVALRPDSADAHNELGVVLAQADRLTEARAQFEAALRLQPAHAAAAANLKRVVFCLDGPR